MNASSLAINLREDGSLFVPADVLRQIGLSAGDAVHVVLEDGLIRVQPIRPVVTRMATEIEAIMAEEGVTLEALLAGLDEVGDEVYREQYGSEQP